MNLSPRLAEPSTRTGAAILTALGVATANNPPVDTVDAVARLILALLGLYEVFRRERPAR